MSPAPRAGRVTPRPQHAHPPRALRHGAGAGQRLRAEPDAGHTVSSARHALTAGAGAMGAASRARVHASDDGRVHAAVGRRGLLAAHPRAHGPARRGVRGHGPRSDGHVREQLRGAPPRLSNCAVASRLTTHHVCVCVLPPRCTPASPAGAAASPTTTSTPPRCAARAAGAQPPRLRTTLASPLRTTWHATRRGTPTSQPPTAKTPRPCGATGTSTASRRAGTPTAQMMRTATTRVATSMPHVPHARAGARESHASDKLQRNGIGVRDTDIRA